MSNITTLEDVEVQLIDHMGNDSDIIQAMLVSTQGENFVFEPEKEAGRINFLMRDRHGSPFEHTALKFYVQAPIFVFREFHRHRIASYNEMSGRYTVLPPEFYIPASDRPLVQQGKPGAYTFVAGTHEQWAEMQEDVLEVYELAWAKYQKMMADGIAKEVARIVLPVGIMSQMYVTMNLRAIFNFLSLRTKEEGSTFPSFPQHEIELVARKIEAHVAELFPLAFAAWNKNGRVAP